MVGERGGRVRKRGQTTLSKLCFPSLWLDIVHSCIGSQMTPRMEKHCKNGPSCYRCEEFALYKHRNKALHGGRLREVTEYTVSERSVGN